MTLDDYLTIWAEWMQAKDGPETYPPIAPGFENAWSSYHVAVEDSNTQADDRERGYGPIIDACIESMDPEERLAIHHVFGFSRTIRTPGQSAGIVFWACMPKLARFVAQRLPLDDAQAQQRA